MIFSLALLLTRSALELGKFANYMAVDDLDFALEILAQSE
jgi:hypothetical protein